MNTPAFETKLTIPPHKVAELLYALHGGNFVPNEGVNLEALIKPMEFSKGELPPAYAGGVLDPTFQTSFV